MERHAKVNVYAKEAVFVTAHLNDFDGDVQKRPRAEIKRKGDLI